MQTTGLAERFGPRRVPVEGRGHARALQNDIVAACVEYLGR